MAIAAENCDDNWLYEYDRSKPLSSQTVYTDVGGSIINVSKIYTNNIYFGVNIFIAADNSIYRVIRCKDNGFTEDNIVNKSYIINKIKKIINNSVYYSINNNYSDVKTVIQDITLPDIGNTSTIVEFCYKDDEYLFTNICVGSTINRSLYSHHDISSLEPQFQKTHITTGQLPTKDRVLQFYEDTQRALNNVYTYVNTEYSQIKVYRKTI
jgi:hypothetical protein